MDRFGATDAWLIFGLWAVATDHEGTALLALAVLLLYSIALDK
jgi:hypothetical protein